jgi:hypothetical protein
MKEPKPPSEAGKGQKYPVPPTLDRVMAHAFKKNAALRIGSVGALADAIGAAYGLTGSHFDWAKTNETELNTRINSALPAIMTAAPVARAANVADSFFGESDSLDTMGDPFAAAAPAPGPAPMGGPPMYGQPMGGQPMYSQPMGGPPMYAPPAAYTPAMDAPPASQFIAGIPKSSNNTVLLLAVGGAALFIGILLVVIFMLFR